MVPWNPDTACMDKCRAVSRGWTVEPHGGGRHPTPAGLSRSNGGLHDGGDTTGCSFSLVRAGLVIVFVLSERRHRFGATHDAIHCCSITIALLLSTAASPLARRQPASSVKSKLVWPVTGSSSSGGPAPAAVYAAARPDHFTLAGTLNGTGGTMHLYVKAKLASGGVLLRGLLIFEPSKITPAFHDFVPQEERDSGVFKVNLVLNSGIKQPPFPGVGLRSLTLGWNRSLELIQSHVVEGTYSYPGFEALLAGPDPADPLGSLPLDIHIFIFGWDRYVPIHDVLFRATSFALAGTGPVRAHHVLPPPYGDPDSFVPLIALNARHHHALGFSSTILYAHTDFHDFLATHPALAPLLRSGTLTLVPWRDPAFYTQPHLWPGRWGAYDLHWIFTHSLLTFWGEGNVRTLFIDADEFVMVPPPAATTVPDMFGPSGCVASHRSLYFERYDIYRTLNASTASLPDIQVVANSTLPPLSFYTLRGSRPLWGKSLPDPNEAFYSFGHLAYVCSNSSMSPHPHVVGMLSGTPVHSPCSPNGGHFETTTVPRNCAWIGHARNMYHVRVPQLDAVVPLDPATHLVVDTPS